MTGWLIRCLKRGLVAGSIIPPHGSQAVQLQDHMGGCKPSIKLGWLDIAVWQINVICI